MKECVQILLVEDDGVIGRTLAGALRDEGFDVEIASGLSAARRAYARGGHAAIVLDLDLPDGAGELLLRDLARRDPPPAAVVISARDYAMRVASRWAIPIVRKPFDLEEVIAAVKVATEVHLVPRPFRASVI